MKLTVPERLKDAAYRLKDNKTIYCGLDDEVKEVVAIAVKQGVLATCSSSGKKYINPSNVSRYHDDKAYCLSDDIEIVVEQEKTWWEKEGLILCEIEEQPSTGWRINYPMGRYYQAETLGVPRCEGYEFVGWAFDGFTEVYAYPFLYLVDEQLWDTYITGAVPMTASATLWKEVK